ncbi:hypothetical protein [Novosphingobium sp. TCA1]|uniref:hypothetical protein n=1 Tax=Novosphingobium sp. TCA1 TaxID=2682474 RepID=UPI00130AC57D|nr:hypothetical protein [Novosphingobium sp. TCA1]GFE72387.1 hypothetical protein NTCA1_00360 [Novosphingobium sp. TCA1]
MIAAPLAFGSGHLFQVFPDVSDYNAETGQTWTDAGAMAFEASPEHEWLIENGIEFRLLTQTAEMVLGDFFVFIEDDEAATAFAGKFIDI